MRACDPDVVARPAERGMGGDTLRTWHNKFAGTDTSKACNRHKHVNVYRLQTIQCF